MQPVVYPFAAIVDQERMRTALLLCATDPSLGGVLIRGSKGTGKTTAARALAALLPPIEVVEGCPYHCAPDDTASMHAGCLEALEESGSLPRELIPTPMVELPLNATEDRLVGTLQIERALQHGERHFEPGLLAAANRGILYVDEVNLLDDHLVDLLLDVAASGISIVEREGISYRHPARFILIGTMNPEEGELRPQLLDRFALCVNAGDITNDDDRKELVRRRLAFEQDPRAFAASFADAQTELGEAVRTARERLARVSLDEAALDLAISLAREAGARGHRAELAMTKAARAYAALSHRSRATAEDIRAVAPLVLLHRLSVSPLAAQGDPEREVSAIIARTASAEGADGADVDRDRSPDDLDEEDDEAWAERMQVPSGTAAGSLPLPLLSKKNRTPSSSPTS